MSWLSLLVLLAIAMILSFGLYMSDVIIQLRRDVQTIRKKVNLMTASPNPPARNKGDDGPMA